MKHDKLRKTNDLLQLLTDMIGRIIMITLLLTVAATPFLGPWFLSTAFMDDKLTEYDNVQMSATFLLWFSLSAIQIGMYMCLYLYFT